MAKITGNNASESLSGSQYSDTIYGGAGNDQLFGLQGNDILEGGTGNDVLRGGDGDDLVRGFSWGGEPVAAQDGTLINAGEPIADSDMLIGGAGSDTFEIRWLIDAKAEILEKHRDPDSGYVDYNAGTGGVAGENNNSHDHWVETQGIGTKTIVDYNEREDTLLFHGHTVNLKSLSHQNGDTILKFYSNQNGNGAHDGDDVGTVIVKGARLDAGDIDVDAGVFFGTETALIRPTTGTGLDTLVDIILSDPNLSTGAPSDEIVEGALAADALNHIIIDAIKGTGVANDGAFNGVEVRELNTYIQQKHSNAWVEHHGNDAGRTETGFHLVQGDGGSTRLFGKIAVTTVAEEIYNLGFNIQGRFLSNEDGGRSQSVNVVANYLNKLLADDLDDGSLSGASGNNTGSGGTNTGGGGTNTGGGGTNTGNLTGTGLDDWVNIILNDPAWPARIGYGLISKADVQAGAEAANGMNHIIVDGIRKTGVANDGSLNGTDMREVNAYIRANHLNEWVRFHGDDEGNAETGFHRVQGDGGASKLYGKNAITTVMDEAYHLGFQIKGKTLYNEDGDANQSINVVARYLNNALATDLANGSLSGGSALPDVGRDTGTGLDDLVDIILADRGLNAKTPISDIHGGAAAANALNHIIVEAIERTGTGSDRKFDGNDMRKLNAYIRQNHYNNWVEHHGDDEGNGTETGFHLVQGDGGTTKLFGKMAINTVMDELYHLGFQINGRTLENEDGDANQSINVVARYLNDLLEDDLASGEFDAVVG